HATHFAIECPTTREVERHAEKILAAEFRAGVVIMYRLRPCNVGAEKVDTHSGANVRLEPIDVRNRVPRGDPEAEIVERAWDGHFAGLEAMEVGVQVVGLGQQVELGREYGTHI